jgi:hypothetical protein
LSLTKAKAGLLQLKELLPIRVSVLAQAMPKRSTDYTMGYIKLF